MKGSAWLIGAAGAWLATSPFLGFVPRTTPWNALAVGFIVAILGVNTARAKRPYGWVAAVLGLWLLGAALLPAIRVAFGGEWHDLVVGTVLAVTGLVAVGSEGSSHPVELFPHPPRVGGPQHRR